MAKKYTRSQTKAYYSGMGYRAAYEGKQIPFKSEKNKDSFRAGWRAAQKPVGKYPNLNNK